MSIFSKVKSFFQNKSAIVYYGKNIEYSKLEAFEYIIVQPDYIDVNNKSFELFKDKMYAYVSVCEISPNVKEYSKVEDTWILSKNESWGSLVLDIKNKEYQEFLFNEFIEKKISLGFKNFFFDTLDSYQLVCTSDIQRELYKKTLVKFINTFHKRYPDVKLIINRGFELIEEVHSSVNAVLFESYYFGLGDGELGYKKVSKDDQEWLDIQIENIQSYSIPIIALEYLAQEDMSKASEAIGIIKSKGMIPYVSNRDLDVYGTGV